MKIYTDEDLKWDKPPLEVCLLIHLSVTVALKYLLGHPQAKQRVSHYKSSRVYNLPDMMNLMCSSPYYINMISSWKWGRTRNIRQSKRFPV